MTEAADEPEYTETLDAMRALRGVRRTADGADIPLDPNSQDFCDYARWATRRPGGAWVWHEGSPEFFADRDLFVRWCKEQAITLWADPAIETGRFRVEEIGLGPPPSFPFRRVFRAVAVQDKHPHAEGGLWYEPIPVFVSPRLALLAQEELCDPLSDIRRLTSWPVEKAFVYVDVSDFSRHPPGQQALIINSLSRLVRESPWELKAKIRRAMKALEAALCIGDGYIYVFRDAGHAAFFAACLAHVIEVRVARAEVPVEFHFRIGVHTGPVYHFWDRRHEGREDWNYIGDGINGGQRVLAAVGKDTDDIVFISDAVRKRIAAQPDGLYREILQPHLRNRGRKRDKHGSYWRVYEVNHTAIGHKHFPAERLR
jgi:class 3 adenylate cyclase